MCRTEEAGVGAIPGFYLLGSHLACREYYTYIVSLKEIGRLGLLNLIIFTEWKSSTILGGGSNLI